MNQVGEETEPQEDRLLSWKRLNGIVCCPRCGAMKNKEYNFLCPNCGALMNGMVEEQSEGANLPYYPAIRRQYCPDGHWTQREEEAFSAFKQEIYTAFFSTMEEVFAGKVSYSNVENVLQAKIKTASRRCCLRLTQSKEDL